MGSMTVSDELQGDEELPGCETCKDFYAKYDVKDVLGRGVSSTVRRCIEKKSGVEFAVKIIDMTSEQGKGSEQEVESFWSTTMREINILRMCSHHPHIIDLYDTFETPTFIFLVFEICKKGELFDYLTQVVTLSEKRTRQLMRQLLEAVIFVHDKNIVHRDLKPENILLDDNMNLKLTDFGFATVIQHDKQMLDLCGTPGYLAPEVLKVSMYENQPGYGKPVDMWAYGVIMFTLLVGFPPFWHRKQMYMLRDIMEGKYSFSSPEWDDISEQPKDLIRRLLVVEPKERLTAHEALEHPFFRREEVEGTRRLSLTLHDIVPPTAEREEKKKFFPRRMFRAAVFTAIAMTRLQRLHLNPPPINISQIQSDPYGSRQLRKLIDGSAFRLYGHWVKRGDNQNRAALFENAPKRDLKLSER